MPVTDTCKVQLVEWGGDVKMFGSMSGAELIMFDSMLFACDIGILSEVIEVIDCILLWTWEAKVWVTIRHRFCDLWLK